MEALEFEVQRLDSWLLGKVMAMSRYSRRLSLLLVLAGSMQLTMAQPPMGGFGPGGMSGGFGGGFSPGSGGPPMMMMGGDRGGMRGGDRGGGGDRGSGGDRGGFRGGFDPSSMLSRLDTNQNGQLDPDEMQGPARFMLERMAQGNPRLDMSKPIPLSTITAEFERMRSERMGGEWSGSLSSGDSDTAAETVLVPGFGTSKSLTPPKGFGSKADVPSVKVEEADMAEAEERVRRYDRNRDNLLDEEEIKAGSWRDDPFQYDRNGDRKLTADELAVRYARRRLAESQPSDSGRDSRDSRSSDRDRRGNWNGAEGGREEKKEESDYIWKDRASFRSSSKKDGSTGLPEAFTSRDRNKDGQLSMKEFTSDWTEEKLAEFLRFDTNTDGVISSKECLTALKNNILFGSTGGGEKSSSESSASSTASASGSAAPAAVGNFNMEGLPPDADKVWVDWVGKRMSEFDKNKSGTLTPDELKDDNFPTIDANKDGQVTFAEFYLYRKNKSKR